MAARRRQADPADTMNRRVLADRQKRIQEQQAAVPELDLDLKIQEKEPESAAAVLRDEFDRRNFGDEVPTYKTIVYGPDPLLTACPEMRDSIERAGGLEPFAEAAAEAIRKRGDGAFPDPVMKRAILKALRKFGVEAVADAFRERLMAIPVREVEVEADRQDIIWGRPLDEAVARYGRPGFAPKFLSERCIAVLGMRGYQIVKDENGDPVKVGTLIMGEIPTRIAERRRELAAQESLDQVREAEEEFAETVDRYARAAGPVGAGSRALQRDEIISANASESEEYVGQQRPAGFQIAGQT